MQVKAEVVTSVGQFSMEWPNLKKKKMMKSSKLHVIYNKHVLYLNLQSTIFFTVNTTSKKY